MTGPIGGAGARPPGSGPAPATGVVRVGPAPSVGATPALEDALRDVLARTGLDLAQLLAGGADALVSRPPTDAVALADVLERARAALVRNAPQELLATLDREWAGAALDPAGWYYRAAALALLGLPGEAELVLGDARALHDAPALAFARSVVRLAAGDLGGARAALREAEARVGMTAPEAGRRLLRAWEAVLLAHRGQRELADGRLAELADEAPDADPTLAWLRRTLARMRLDTVRRASPTVEPPVPEVPPDIGRPGALDPLAQTLRQLGTRFEGAPTRADRGPPSPLAADVLSTLQALATGGTLWDAGQPARVLAARSVLSTALQLLLEPDVALHGRASRLTPITAARVPETPPGGDAATSGANPPSDAPASRDAAMLPNDSAAPGDGPDAPRWSRVALSALLEGDGSSARALLPRIAATEGAPIAAVLAPLLGAPESGPDHAFGATAAPVAASLDDQLAMPLRLGLVFVPVNAPLTRRTRGGAPIDGVLLDGRLATDRVGAIARDGEGDAPRALPRPPRRRWLWLLALLTGAVWWLSR